MRYDQSWNAATIGAVSCPVPDVRLIEIHPDNGRTEAYAPGSHINVRIPIGDRLETRSFSLVGVPDPVCYRVGVKRRLDSRGGSTHMWSTRSGDPIEVSGPNNLFPLDHGNAEYLLIAAGIGITPIYGMVRALVRTGASVRMLYIGKERTTMLFVNELEALLGDRLLVHCSDVSGRIEPGPYLDDLGPEATVYMCGPIGLMDRIRRDWTRAGRQPSLLRYETFGSSGAFAPERFWVKVPSFDRQFTVEPNESLLARLRTEGVDVISDCERGECGTCQLGILEVEGTVDHRDVFFSDHEKNEGRKICVCVSRVVGGGITLDALYRPDAPVE